MRPSNEAMPKSVRDTNNPSIAPTAESGRESAMASGSCQLRNRNQSTAMTQMAARPSTSANWPNTLAACADSPPSARVTPGGSISGAARSISRVAAPMA